MAEGAVVNLRQMTEDEFEEWRPRSIESFANELARATGRPLEDARARASQQFEETLPDGQRTADTWFLIIENEAGERVGQMWLGAHPNRAGVGYVYDIEVDEVQRGRGYGRAAMLAAEGLVRDAGMNELGLSVFGFNVNAQRLYESIGYRVVASQMTKRL